MGDSCFFCCVACGVWEVSCCTIPPLNALGVPQYMQLYVDRHVPRAERIVCVTAFYYPTTWAATHHLWTICFNFLWRADAVTLGAYHG